jgi:hypothetical protein
MYRLNGGAHSWSTAISGSANAAITFTQAMTLTAAGRLLIGTPTEATYMLDVNGTGRFSGAITAATESTFTGTSANTRLLITASGVANTVIGFNNSGSTTTGVINNAAYVGVLQAYPLIFTTDSVARLTIASTGAATFSSSVTATSFFESSDSRLKILIQDNYQTKGIASITPKLYTKNGKVELGYYAQDFVGVLDSAVSKGSDDMLSLSYREVHTAKIYALEQRIKELEGRKFNISTTKLK